MTRNATTEATAYLVSATRKGHTRYVSSHQGFWYRRSDRRAEWTNNRSAAELFDAAPALRKGHKVEAVTVYLHHYVSDYMADRYDDEPITIDTIWTMSPELANTRADAVAEYTAKLQAKIAAAVALLG